MPKLIILGSANAISDEKHENSHMVIQGRERTIMIDCVNNPLLRLRRVGVDFNTLSDLILTHFHPDHVSGVPTLLMNMWLLGRKPPLNIYGLHHTLDRIESLMDSYDWSHWPNFFPVAFYRLPEQDMILVLESTEFRVFASPVCHLLPTIGLRIECRESNKVLAYSCDTEPCPQVVKLAGGADVLIHEATGPGAGHSTASQAAGIAREAKVSNLYLIHYPTGDFDGRKLVKEAQNVYEGKVFLAEDFLEIDLNEPARGYTGTVV
jgi:ribonuclease Z